MQSVADLRISQNYQMGNVNGIEDPARSDVDPVSQENSGRRRAHIPSLDSMGNSPPESPGRSQSPLLFAPQVPVAPLQRVSDVPPVFNKIRMNESHSFSDLSPEKGIPTMITWNYEGKDVAVEGSWDNWTSRKILQRSGKDHSILLVLTSGTYHYKFIVDGEWRYIPDLPYVADEMGCLTNILDVHDYVPENIEGIAEFQPPTSPDSSYDQLFPVDEDFTKEPLTVPPQLHLTILGMQNPDTDASARPQHDYVPENIEGIAEFQPPTSPDSSYDQLFPVDEDFTKEPLTVPPQLHLTILGMQNPDTDASARPQHVVLNHLFIEKGWASQSLVALGLTHRFQSKYVTVVLYKPLRK
ncbi:SNF1-related protein kinase regulatory subunit beta-1 [Cinnamomum micranthum f. kanehirae]|uniref:SNF1-related protein kinase regulatory subunit beta-1 n=1 Tax=Cinnamomum micranthum f. kanehirae TaxID=337451 RepID=A0A443N8H9_9MAGN|nr:SNF1-related protein kinase regulatory subunit beta-1 [Cinnamomum micranthum f. kanehirae]